MNKHANDMTLLPVRNEILLFTEKPPPELSRVCLGDAKGVSLKLALGEDGLNLSQHMAEDE